MNHIHEFNAVRDGLLDLHDSLCRDRAASSAPYLYDGALKAVSECVSKLAEAQTLASSAEMLDRGRTE